ncbi:uncharacterized protein LOC118348156 [Juglans regia]|uniref:Uncharacterized protein LOC118348156 n=1 Tax=Juglans regia TaxID=51240 RepID=A0A6P9E9Y8_JUGRE|nr:uncharacterized protein LOC118348156 [Juglans regia]
MTSEVISISPGEREDKLVWQFTTNGIYTVKSRYHLSKELECDLEGETSVKAKEKQAWKTIWKLRVTAATKMFLWRACNEALPLLANMRRREVVEHSSCLVCKQEPETPGHVLWGCIAAKDVWGQGVMKVQKLSFQSDLIFDIWSRLIEILSSEELDEVAVTMRGIWSRRNNVIHGKEFKHPTPVHQHAKAELVSYREALTEDLEVKLTAPDAAVNSKEERIGIGVLIRDHHGLVIGGLRANRTLKGIPFDAEANGLLLAAAYKKIFDEESKLGDITGSGLGTTDEEVGVGTQNDIVTQSRLLGNEEYFRSCYLVNCP